VITGYNYTKVKGVVTQVPVYGYRDHLVTRCSDDGGANWKKVDDCIDEQGWGIADLNGTIYVVGRTASGSAAVARTNANGMWEPADTFAGAEYYAVTIDPTTHTPYAGGNISDNTWLVRSDPAPATNVFSSTPVTSTSSAGDQSLVDELFGAAV
jgi:hypothetical protein